MIDDAALALIESLEQRVKYLETLQAQPANVVRVTIKAVDYTLTSTDSFVVFTATGKTATLPAATGSGRTYRIAYEGASGSLTIDGNASETIKGATTQTLYVNEDLIITDYDTGKWA